jgi:hypothetical protein
MMDWPFDPIGTIYILVIGLIVCFSVLLYQMIHSRILRRDRDQARRELLHEIERRLMEVERTKYEASRADAEAIRVGKLTSAINHALDRNVQMQEEMRRFLQIMEKSLSREPSTLPQEPTKWPNFTRPSPLAPPPEPKE